MLAEKPSDVLNGVWRELPRRSEAASQISEDEGKVCSATILPKKLRRRYRWCEAIVRWKNAVSQARSWLKSPFWITVVLPSPSVIKPHARFAPWWLGGARGRHTMPLSSIFISFLKTSSTPRGVHPQDSSIIIFIVAVVVFVVSAVGFYSQRGVTLLSRTDIPAKTFRSRVFWINWICADRFPLFLLVPLHLQTLISSLIHTHTYTYTLTQSHTKSLDKKHSTHSQIKHEKPQQPSS